MPRRKQTDRDETKGVLAGRARYVGEDAPDGVLAGESVGGGVTEKGAEPGVPEGGAKPGEEQRSNVLENEA